LDIYKSINWKSVIHHLTPVGLIYTFLLKGFLHVVELLVSSIKYLGNFGSQFCNTMSKRASLSENEELAKRSKLTEGQFKVPAVPHCPVLPKLSKETVQEFTRVFVKINLLNWDEVLKKYFELQDGREKEVLKCTIRLVDF